MLNNIVNSGLQPAVKVREAEAKPTLAVTNPEKTDVTTQPEQNVTPEPAELESAVTKLNDYVQNIQRTLSFSVEQTTGSTVVQVYDSETDELIRQIPAEETIKLAAKIEAYNASLFIKEQA
jgi:flagellar protein FlaG